MHRKCIERVMVLAVSASLWASLAQADGYGGNPNTLAVHSVAEFGQCAQATDGSQECLDALQRYVAEQPEDAAPAAKRVRREYRHFAALPFFVHALQQQGANDLCADEDLALAVTSGLALPSDYPQVAIAKQIAEDSCWAALQPRIESDIRTLGGYYKTNACPLLLTKGAAPDCEMNAAAQVETIGLDPEMRALQSLKWKEVKLDSQQAMAFRGDRNEEVFMVRAAAPNDRLYVARLKSIQGEWRDRVFAMREYPTGGNDLNYVTVINDREYVLLTVRNGHYEAHPEGYATGIDLHAINLSKPEDALKEFRRLTDKSSWMSIAF